MNGLPALHDLQAFEAAARHGSFLKASRELHLTQSAISHRIKVLEEHLDVVLFVRVNRNIALTPQGERFVAQVSQILAQLREATHHVQNTRRHARVTLSVMPALGSRWLVAKLAEFQKLHPEIDVAVATPYQADDIAHGKVDFGIRFGIESRGDLVSAALIDETVFPVAARTVVRAAALKMPEDLSGVSLLRHPLLAWEPWFKAAGLNWREPEHGPLYDDATLLYEAVAAGAGVALIPRTLFLASPKSMGLVKPFRAELAGHTYALVTRRGTPTPYAAALIDWLTQKDYLHNFHASVKSFRL